MKLLSLSVVDFAAIAKAEIAFGKGLNVLYGPNDLGKSTLAEAIRVGLLLPHTSTVGEQFMPWRGGYQPIVEITFETEEQRLWRVTKRFGRNGSSVIQESRNGVDFDEVAKGRSVEGKLRETLSWGIAEPGGVGSSKGIPKSFLATTLLSTQGDVSAVLRDSLQGDAISSGKEKIASALQTMAQDPLFLSLLRTVQARRDEAYTEKGMKKTAKDSPFKTAAERLRESREEKERLEAAVNDSQGVEHKLRDLMIRRGIAEESVANATDRLTTFERLAAEGKDRIVAEEQGREHRDEVTRVQKLVSDVLTAERNVAELVAKKEHAGQALRDLQNNEIEAQTSLTA